MSVTAETRLAPPDLTRAIKRITVGKRARGKTQTQKILERANRYGIELVDELRQDHGSVNQEFRYEKQTLKLDYNQGSFIKPWASDSAQIGRDEWCLTPVEGCPLDCNYCYLQDYLDQPLVKVFVNSEEMANQIECFLDDPPEEPPHFFSLGELSDGLFLQPLFGHVETIWDTFRGREQAFLEVRSKSHHIHGLLDEISPHQQGVFSWSLSPETMAQRDEMLTSSLEQRLTALKLTSQHGFRTGIRIDPILLREGWQEAYQTLVETIVSTVQPSSLSFVILGTFRFPRGFDRTMRERFSNRSFLRDEFLQGPDGTFRYARDRRTSAFQKFREWLEPHGIQPDLCMEPRYVWEDAGIPVQPGQHA